MFAPMTAQTEYARFEAENAELQRRAANLMQVQLTPSTSLLNDFVQRFTDWALHRQNQPVNAPLHETATDCC